MKECVILLIYLQRLSTLFFWVDYIKVRLRKVIVFMTKKLYKGVKSNMLMLVLCMYVCIWKILILNDIMSAFETQKKNIIYSCLSVCPFMRYF